MIWQNGWAWAGLATLALPVLIHLLGRGRTRVYPFPTLRFVPQSRLLPSQRTRLHDLLLLAIRLAILLSAVAALAGPLWRTSGRTTRLNNILVRAIIVDTSASMSRGTPQEEALQVAHRHAQALADSSQLHVTVATASPASAIPGAVAWLDRQEGRRELVVVSDFQLGTLLRSDLSGVPADDGIRLVRMTPMREGPPLPDTARSPSAVASVAWTRFGSRSVSARTELRPDRSEVEWRSAGLAHDTGGVTVLTGPADQDGARAALATAAAMAISGLVDTERLVSVVLPHAPERADLLKQLQPLDTPWMGDVAVQVKGDSLLQAAAAIETAFNTSDSARALVIARTATGRPVLVAGSATVAGRKRLLFFPLVDAGSLTSAALLVAAARARAVTTPVSELNPAALDDSVLVAWQRPPAADGHPAIDAGADAGPSDGRWFWVVALLLLGIETWFRRRPSEMRRAEMSHDAAA